MKNRSFSQQWSNLSGFWKLIYSIVLISMPWTILLIIWGIWHLDSRIEGLHEEIEVNNKKNNLELDTSYTSIINLEIEDHQVDLIEPYRIDTLEKYQKTPY